MGNEWQQYRPAPHSANWKILEAKAQLEVIVRDAVFVSTTATDQSSSAALDRLMDRMGRVYTRPTPTAQ